MRTARRIAFPFLASPVLAIAPALLLAACDSAKPERDPGDTSGEVLPGTISDDMIALDQLRSQGESLKPEDAATDAAATPGRPAVPAEPAGEDATAPEAPAEPAADAADDAPDEG